MKCQEIRSTQILEFLYGTLTGDKRAAVESHLKNCETCRTELERLRDVLASVSQVAGDMVLFYLAELDEHGIPTYIIWGRMTNTSDQPMREFEMITAPERVIDFAAFQGEKTPLECGPWDQDPTHFRYVALLPLPVMPGESFNGMTVSHYTDQTDRASEVGNHHWRFTQRLGLGEQRDAVLIVQAIRLPMGASLVSTSPEAESSTGKHATTVLWRLMPTPSTPMDFSVEYRL